MSNPKTMPETPPKVLSDFVASSGADTENLVERVGGKSVIRRGDRSHQTLRVAQFYSEDVNNETANVVCARNVDLEIKRAGMLLEKPLPPPGLRLGVMHQFVKADPCYHVVSLSRNAQEFVEEPNQVLPDKVINDQNAKIPGREKGVTDSYCLEQDQSLLRYRQEAQ